MCTPNSKVSEMGKLVGKRKTCQDQDDGEQGNENLFDHVKYLGIVDSNIQHSGESPKSKKNGILKGDYKSGQSIC
jgi:hypothetical protein